MSIEYIKADMLKETTGFLVHGCNTAGGFGAGIAGQIRKKYPQVYDQFLKQKKGIESLGEIQVIHISDELSIINAFTQLKYGYDGKKYADSSAIRRCMNQIFFLGDLFNKEIKMPKIGCGLGGLSWENDVHPIIEELNKKYNKLTIKIYEI